jgi:hypothetical protein
LWRRARRGLSLEEEAEVQTSRYAGQPRPSRRDFRRRKAFAWAYAVLWLAALAAAVAWLGGSGLIIVAIVVLMLLTPDVETLFGRYRTELEQWTAANQARERGASEPLSE